LSSCEIPEEPIAPHVSGNMTIASVNVGPAYDQQLFYDLENQTIISQNNKYDWDFSLNNRGDQLQLKLNMSKFMNVAISNQTFNNFYDTIGLVFKHDYQTGLTQDLALSKGWPPNRTLVLDQGLNNRGSGIGFKVVTYEFVDESKIMLTTKNIDGSNKLTFIIHLNAVKSYVSLEIGEVDIEPEFSSWDVLFTQYVELVDNTPYLVFGVLLNPNGVVAYKDSTTLFTDIIYNTYMNASFSSLLNTVGYNWKTYHYESGLYEIDASYSYLVKTSGGYLIKFRFIDFYDNQGNKGFPTIEMQQL
jgi:hypothetical protein